jgi:hypothetical protein
MTTRRFLSALGLSVVVCTVGPVARVVGQSAPGSTGTTVEVDGLSVEMQSVEPQSTRIYVTVKGVQLGCTLESSKFEITVTSDGLLITSNDSTTLTTGTSDHLTASRFAHLKWQISQGGKSMYMGWWK